MLKKNALRLLALAAVLRPAARAFLAFAAFCSLFVPVSATSNAENDVVFADFDGITYTGWKTEGSAFGAGPAFGTLPGQMPVTGFRGVGLASSFHGGDSATGRLISPEFIISRKYVAFRIGGGYGGRTCINLIVDGSIVRTTAGPNTRPGGSEALAMRGWDVKDFRGRTAHLEIVDTETGGWGHITVDQITFTETKPPLTPVLRPAVSRIVSAKERWLNFPVRNDAPLRNVSVHVDGRVVRQFEIALADTEQPDWWAASEVLPWKGKTLTITVDELPEGSKALESVTNTAQITGSEALYKEALRPQFHFSAQRGWLNDPNGLVYFQGEYHLFFQHVPFSRSDGAKHWGQAVSQDLVHWVEVGEALYPDELGPMWSGSAVVDTKNTSGFGADGKPPLVLIYTAAGDPFTQCIAYSTDGRHFTKYTGNPVVANITSGNRDPRVFWYEPTQRWIQALYVEKDRVHTVHFLTSPNLHDWTLASVTSGKPGTSYLYECPDFFALPLDGDSQKTKWILLGADTQYTVGSFDGATFVPETEPLTGQRGLDFYAAQTFNSAPKNRRIQIGWWRTETTGMPFNQSMSLPIEMNLISTDNGPRLTWTPVKELESLRTTVHPVGPTTISEAGANPLEAIRGELFEIRAEFSPGSAATVAFRVRGIPVIYDARKEEISVNGHAAAAPLRGGKQRLTIYVDRTGIEVFASDGLSFIPMPINLKPEEKSLSVSVQGGSVSFDRLTVYNLRSAWRK